jgi:ribonuclease P protein component
MADRRAETLGVRHRLRTSRDYAAVKEHGRVHRGRHCLLLHAVRPGEPTRFGFIASRKGVGNAVQRNRARRRLREIVRRRWPEMMDSGHWIAFVAHAGALEAPHAELVAEVERLLTETGVFGAAART